MATRVRSPILSSDDIGQLLVQVIHGAAGGSEAVWRKVVGEMERVPTWQLVSHNWRVTPTGTTKQRNTVERAVAIVREAHPSNKNASGR